MNSNKQLRGFALLTPGRRKEISSKGGKTAHAGGFAHTWKTDIEGARKAGIKGGSAPHQNRKKTVEPDESGVHRFADPEVSTGIQDDFLLQGEVK